ncbi:MAG: DNA-binding transcriptional response regulator, NtrC family [Candidatus Electronema aureum]|uniref:DNA-binding transcriptional response regulator, NtrC family n=1 Tax=Candidatus Electronema aureum TaxID=2005002 RepID=A0A521G4H7_9BACT|nr:MAG: DNA-binding transcriptional response regulator, NtrC family [Candidatus Electronema aureum]
MEQAKILVVDDEQAATRNLQHILSKEGYEVISTQSGQNALKLIEQHALDLVLTDLRMPNVDGMEILRRVKEVSPDSEVIMITGYATVSSAVSAMKMGAYHYVIKPYKLDEVRKVVREALEKRRLRRENMELKERLAKAQGVSILTEDPAMQKLLQTAREVALSDCSVLISGDSGTGKELLARYIHEHSPRAAGPLKAVNCGVFTEDLLANELFGHEKGAFTSADRHKIGLIESAGGGTLFLDEVTEMTLAMQVKLLRVLQEKEVLPLGATESLKVNVRFLAATNRDLAQMVKEGGFRQDLYFRINVMHLHLPPLAERRRDIRLLAQFFLDRFSALMNKPVRELTSEALERLLDYDFPGNVRELENIIERAVVLASGERIETAHLPTDVDVKTFRAPTTEPSGTMPSLDDQERSYIEWVLAQTGNNKSKAAEVLGINRVSLWRKLKKYHLEGSDDLA